MLQLLADLLLPNPIEFLINFLSHLSKIEVDILVKNLVILVILGLGGGCPGVVLIRLNMSNVPERNKSKYPSEIATGNLSKSPADASNFPGVNFRETLNSQM